MADKGKKRNHVVIFVEGDTDKVFFDRLLRHYKEHSITPICSYDIFNMRGVSRFVTKFILKLRNDVIPKAREKHLTISAVCCSYDTDVFEDTDSPVVDWNSVRKDVNRLGIVNFFELEVRSSIEDWLLDDIDGLCAYLRLKQPPTVISGRTGNERMVNLFKRANKKYYKGFQIEGFIDMLDFSVIRNKHLQALHPLEEALGVKMK